MDYELTKESSRSVVFSEDDKPIIVRSERLLSTQNSQSIRTVDYQPAFLVSGANGQLAAFMLN